MVFNFVTGLNLLCKHKYDCQSATMRTFDANSVRSWNIDKQTEISSLPNIWHAWTAAAWWKMNDQLICQ